MLGRILTQFKRFSAKNTPYSPSPREKYGDLFVGGQLAHATLDNKSFADAEARMTPGATRRAYLREKKKRGDDFSYNSFVHTYFILPEFDEAQTLREPKGEREDVRAHIERMWGELTRGPDAPIRKDSLIPLHRQYVVPGGRFRELYYWDSYYTMQGLVASGRINLVEDMVENFAYLLRTFGHIPNGTRTYYLTRSNQPHFALMVELLASVVGNEAYTRYLTEMDIEYAYFMRGADTQPNDTPTVVRRTEHVVTLPDGTILNRYYDTSDFPREEMLADDVATHPLGAERDPLYRSLRATCESGWDFSTRWLADPHDPKSNRTVSLLPVDLNVLMLRMEQILAKAYTLRGDMERARTMEIAVARRTEAINTLFYNETAGWFEDYEYLDSACTGFASLAGIYPMWAGIVTQERADAMAHTLSKLFLREGGLVTTLINSGEQWDAPNGWAPLHYIAVEGLLRYGHHALARDIATRWCHTCFRGFKRFGSLLEKYNVENPGEIAGGGEYGVQDGFGWTNAVLLHFMTIFSIEYIHDTI